MPNSYLEFGNKEPNSQKPVIWISAIPVISAVYYRQIPLNKAEAESKLSFICRQIPTEYKGEKRVIMRVFKHWNNLLRKVAESASLEIFRTLNSALSRKSNFFILDVHNIVVHYYYNLQHTENVIHLSVLFLVLNNLFLAVLCKHFCFLNPTTKKLQNNFPSWQTIFC